MINILVTTAGSTSGVNCIMALKHQEEMEINIVASDLHNYAAGLYLANKYYLVPPFSIEVKYLEAIINICKKEKIDVVLPTFSSDIYLFSKYASELTSNGVNFFISPFTTVELFRNKLHSYAFFKTNNIPTPDTKLLSEINTFKYPIFIKPIIGSGSKKAIRINNDQELYCCTTAENANQYIFQPYITAPEFTVDILVGNTNKIEGLVARQRLKTKDGIAIVSRTVDSTPILPIISRILSEIEIRGPINIQYFILENETPLIIDINTRFAAGGLPLTIKAGINFPLETVKLSLGIPTKDFDGYRVGVTMIRYYTELFV